MMSRSIKKNDNIFEELGFSHDEASNLHLRAQLMVAVKRYVKSENLTQAQAAELMGVDQPKINKLLSGKIELFTIDLLVNMLERAGVHVTMKIAA